MALENRPISFFRALRRHDYLALFHDAMGIAQRDPTSAALHKLFFVAMAEHENYSKLRAL